MICIKQKLIRMSLCLRKAAYHNVEIVLVVLEFSFFLLLKMLHILFDMR